MEGEELVLVMSWELGFKKETLSLKVLPCEMLGIKCLFQGRAPMLLVEVDGEDRLDGWICWRL